MRIVRTKKQLETIIADWKAHKNRIGLVPTMGALHDGHLSLVKAAQENAEKVIASIFVNPTQFAPHEDYESYPRNESQDTQKLKEVGIDLVYMPSAEEMYPNATYPNISPGEAANGLETDHRPHFFGGVVNAVSRLFEHINPDIAVFGEKDFQQLQVVREMVKQYSFPVNIIGASIVRDKYGLALSSRNAYLSQNEQKVARCLNRILFETALDLKKAQTHSHRILKNAETELIRAGFEKIDYLSVRWNRLLVAAWIGKTRLIDNVPTL